MPSNNSKKIFEKYVTELIEPKLGKSKFQVNTKPASSDLNRDGEVDSFEKNVRQLIYDARHIANKEGIPMQAAFAKRAAKVKKYTPDVVKAAKDKLGITSSVSEENIIEADGQQMIPVVIKYKNGTVDRRRVPRTEIAILRAKPTVSSVEITKYGVADRDYDHDGKIESGKDEHAGAVHNAIQRKIGGVPDGNPPKKRLKSYGVKEGFSNWRQDLYEIMDDGLDPDEKDMVKEKKVNNYTGKKPVVEISPKLDMKESLKKIGAEAVEISDITEEELLFERVKKFIHERHLTKGEKKKIETLGKKTGKALIAMKNRYGSKKGESVWYGWKTNVAKKSVKEAVMPPTNPLETQDSTQDKQRTLQGQIRKRRLRAAQETEFAQRLITKAIRGGADIH